MTKRLRVALEVIGGFSGRKFHVAVIVMGQSWMRSATSSQPLPSSGCALMRRGP